MSEEKEEYIKYRYPNSNNEVNLRLNTNFDTISPKYWDSSGMKFDNEQRLWYGKIPNTTVHTVLIGSGFYVEENRDSEPEVEDFIRATLLKYPPASYNLTSKEHILIDKIRNGESEKLEFKTTFKWDIKEQKINKELPKMVSKAVSAFLNAGGGTLLIGITDDRKIHGLNNDLKHCYKSLDALQQDIPNIIRRDLGGAGLNYSMNIQKLEQKQICLIEVSPSEEPVFFNNSEYYVRKGTSNQSLNPKETHEHIKNRFPRIYDKYIEDYIEDEENEDIHVNTEIIKNYIEMLRKNEVSTKNLDNHINAIKSEAINIYLKRNLGKEILETSKDLVIFICEYLKDKSEKIKNQLLEILSYLAKNPELTDIIRQIDFKNLIELYEKGGREGDLIFVLNKYGYFKDIKAFILNAIDLRDDRLLKELSRFITTEQIKEEKYDLIKILYSKIDNLDSQKDMELTETLRKLINKIESL